ncbi:MAG: CRTAC1 family protein [Verrucomicrobiia bacterium]
MNSTWTPRSRADYDNDGFLDLYIANGGGNTKQANFLYRNNRDGTFTRITEGPLVKEVGLSAGAAWGDYDNDGFTDLLASGFGNDESFVYRNKGNATFEKMTRDSIGISLGTCQGSWADYDQDGFLDLFAGGLFDQASRLYRNNGNGKFSELTNNSLATTLGSPFSCPWADYDNDGRVDLFIANNEGTNFLFRNLGGGDFARIQEGPIVDQSDDPSIGAAWGDYDNDGFLDLFVANGGWLSSFQSYLYHNRGDGTFTRVTDGSLVTDSRPWVAGAWEDYDNDGDLDLFVTSFGPNNALYRNNGNGTFDPVTTGSLVNDVAPIDAGGSCGAAWGDYNKDGFPDLFVANWDRKNYLYRNNSNGNHWLTVQCVGRVSNRSAIGAKVRVQATIQGKTYWQMREISCGDGFAGNSLDAHFGLGDATKATTLRIEWPSGIVQELHDVAVDQYLKIEEQQPGPSLAQPRVTTVRDFEFTLMSDVGKPCCVEVSSDLVKWTSLQDVTPTQPAQVVNGGPVGSNLTRFYRVTVKN